MIDLIQQENKRRELRLEDVILAVADPAVCRARGAARRAAPNEWYLREQQMGPQ